MAIGKKQFWESERDKILKMHEKYSARDKNGLVHCAECPYGSKVEGKCLFTKQLNEWEKKI